MTLQEAIKSGKRFKRPFDAAWIEPVTGYYLEGEDILADDWEIEEQKVEITKSKLADAYDKALADWTACWSLGDKSKHYSSVLNNMTRYLGL